MKDINGSLKKWTNKKFFVRMIAIVKRPNFGRVYMLIGLAVLGLTTVVWSVHGAEVNSGNADQLINSYFFENSSSLNGALWPPAHSLLLKWPLFLLIKVFGFSSISFTVLTVGLSLLTVGLFAAILFKIERRPLVFGNICLALASVLLMVPIQPYAGALLPVSLAMVTTRNIEYILYILSLFLIARYFKLRHKLFWAPVVLLALLIASDRLFLILSLDGALVALIFYAFNKGWNMVTLSVNWLMASLGGLIGAVCLLWAVNAAHITHFSNDFGGSPYNVVHTSHQIILGCLYAVMGILTNFGANPAYDSTTVRSIPTHSWHGLAGIGGFPFIVNALIMLFGVFAAWRLVLISLKYNRVKSELAAATRVAFMLIWTTVAAVIIFILSNHYYAVDARYLTIAFFCLFFAIAVVGRQRKWSPLKLLVAGFILLIAVGLGLAANYKNYQKDQTALAPISARNALIANVLKQHRVNVVVGDYWRVIPIKFRMGKTQKVLPLAGCTTPSQALSSTAWQPNLNKTSFAYLLTFDKSLTNYPTCTLNGVIAKYGRPNASFVVAGSLPDPREVLLFYDSGAHKSSPKVLTKIPSTVLPIDLEELPYTNCSAPTSINIVAHQDDDLLFLNPDVLHDIKANYCVRTIYLTAGDAGNGPAYWLSREQGSEAAYSQMLGTNEIWVNRIVRMPDGQYVNVANPRANSRISLIFMHLPDGNPKGTGFRQTGFESLARVASNQISVIHSVDGQSRYTSSELVNTLNILMQTYSPALIRTQSINAGQAFRDHSDHNTVGIYVNQAHQLYTQTHFANKVIIPIEHYLGYPIHGLPPNVEGQDLNDKLAAFYAYGNYDIGVCNSEQTCSHSAYRFYLPRMYQSEE